MLICSIKIVPSAGRAEFIVDKEGRLKCFLKSPPEKGKANRELIKLLAHELSFPQQDIAIIGGLTSRTKRIKISREITWQQLLEKLGIHYQQKIS